MPDGNHVALLVEDCFEDIELTECERMMREESNYTVIIGSQAQRKYTGKRGNASVFSDISIADAMAKDYHAVIVPGGYAPDRMRLNPQFVKFVKDMYELGKIIAAICHGPQLLISADIVRNKQVTSWPSIKDDLVNAGAIWLDKRVVKDGNIITSRKPADLPYFNKAIFEALAISNLTHERINNTEI